MTCDGLRSPRSDQLADVANVHGREKEREKERERERERESEIDVHNQNARHSVCPERLPDSDQELSITNRCYVSLFLAGIPAPKAPSQYAQWTSRLQ